MRLKAGPGELAENCLPTASLLFSSPPHGVGEEKDPGVILRWPPPRRSARPGTPGNITEMSSHI